MQLGSDALPNPERISSLSDILPGMTKARAKARLARAGRRGADAFDLPANAILVIQ